VVKSVKPDGGESDSWWGTAAYLNFDPSSALGITLRGEYFDDKKGVTGVVNTSVFDATLSFNIHIDNLTIIPELRLDAAQDPIFFKNSGEPIKSTGSFILAATYHF